MNYFISDLHFGHKNCMAFDNRPFKSIIENDETIIKNWNNTVGIDDDVYLLGDISWYNTTKTIEIFNNLNGHIHLIKGNHDSRLLKNRELQSRFCEITDYKELDIGNGKIVVLCHYPIPCFKNHYHGSYHLYGHVHTGFEDDEEDDKFYKDVENNISAYALFFAKVRKGEVWNKEMGKAAVNKAVEPLKNLSYKQV